MDVNSSRKGMLTIKLFSFGCVIYSSRNWVLLETISYHTNGNHIITGFAVSKCTTQRRNGAYSYAIGDYREHGCAV